MLTVGGQSQKACQLLRLVKPSIDVCLFWCRAAGGVSKIMFKKKRHFTFLYVLFYIPLAYLFFLETKLNKVKNGFNSFCQDGQLLRGNYIWRQNVDYVTERPNPCSCLDKPLLQGFDVHTFHNLDNTYSP